MGVLQGLGTARGQLILPGEAKRECASRGRGPTAFSNCNGEIANGLCEPFGMEPGARWLVQRGRFWAAPRGGGTIPTVGSRASRGRFAHGVRGIGHRARGHGGIGASVHRGGDTSRSRHGTKERARRRSGDTKICNRPDSAPGFQRIRCGIRRGGGAILLGRVWGSARDRLDAGAPVSEMGGAMRAGARSVAPVPRGRRPDLRRGSPGILQPPGALSVGGFPRGDRSGPPR